MNFFIQLFYFYFFIFLILIIRRNSFALVLFSDVTYSLQQKYASRLVYIVKTMLTNKLTFAFLLLPNFQTTEKWCTFKSLIYFYIFETYLNKNILKIYFIKKFDNRKNLC